MGGAKGGGGGGGPKGEDPKISRFFFLLPPPFRFFSLSLCLLVEFCGVLKRWGHQMCTFGVLGLLCEAPAASELS